MSAVRENLTLAIVFLLLCKHAESDWLRFLTLSAAAACILVAVLDLLVLLGAN